jgi:Zn-dependent protease/predicted transcriptional regulator
MDSKNRSPARGGSGPSRWAWKLGQVLGIGIYVHATFWLLVLWIGLSYLVASGSALAAFSGVALVLCVFGIVVFHELGHALVARSFGIRTRDITLYPIGGVASLERIPERPVQELLVTLAGPAVNVLLGALLFVVLALGNEPIDANALLLPSGSFLVKLFFINLTIAVFNLIPAFPMDGGRVLRALLALRMDYVRATEVAARIGQALAIVFGLIGVYTNPMLILIALFVWLGAKHESSFAQLRSALAGIPVRRAMVTDFRTLSRGDELGQAADLLIAGSQGDFPVVEAGRPVGLLTRTELSEGLARAGVAAPVGAWMKQDFDVVGEAERVDVVMNRIREQEAAVLVIDEHGLLVGMLTPENLAELMMLARALRRDNQGRPPVPRTV